MASNFSFLDSHMTVRTQTSQLERLTVPAPASGVDEEDDAISVTSSQVPSQVATSSQGTSQQPSDTRSPRPSSGVRRVDNAILSLVEQMNMNTAVQNRPQTTEQKASRPRIAFFQCMGLEMAKLDEPLWNDFMDEAYGLFSKYKRAQSQLQNAAPPCPPPVSQPPMQPMQPMQPQPPPVWPYNMPPQPSPSYRQQQAWQASPSTSTDYQHPGWGPYAPNQSALKTSSLSTHLDPAHTVPVHPSSALSTPDGHRPGSRASSLGDRASTSDIVRAAQNILDDAEEEPSK